MIVDIILKALTINPMLQNKTSMLVVSSCNYIIIFIYREIDEKTPANGSNSE